MSIILLIRCEDDLNSAIEGANRFLATRRRKCTAPCQDDEVLGIWLRHDLDEGLPVSYLSNQPEARAPFTECNPVLSNAAVGMQCSVSHSGFWSLCWMDGSQLREAKTASERRRRIVAALWNPAFISQSWRRRGLFFPVFDAAESVGSVDAAMQELRRDYPQLTSRTWFVGDSKRGILTACTVEA